MRKKSIGITVRTKMSVSERLALAKERYEFADSLYASTSLCIRAWIWGFLGIYKKEN